jgi:hypothetical protein
VGAIELLERRRVAVPATLGQLEIDCSHVSCGVRRAVCCGGLPRGGSGHDCHTVHRRPAPNNGS